MHHGQKADLIKGIASPLIRPTSSALASSMVFQTKVFSKVVAHPSPSAGNEILSNNAPGPFSRMGDFMPAEGTHMKLSQGLPFVLTINGGEVLVRILEEFDVQIHQDNAPTFVYVEPGPNVSTLDSGTSFTLFVSGRLFLVQVQRVLRQPHSGKAVTVNLLSLSPDEAVRPESLQVPPCTGASYLRSEENPGHQPSTPGVTLEVQCPESGLGLSSVRISDCQPGVAGPELLSPNYGWPRTTSPLPFGLEDTSHDSPRMANTTPHGTMGNNFVCPLNTPADTPSQNKTESLIAQHGSLLCRELATKSDVGVTIDLHETVEDIEKGINCLWPSPVVVAPSGSETQTVGRPSSPWGQNSKSGARLARIIGSSFSRTPEARKGLGSLKPEFDPKVSAVNDPSAGSCRSPFPLPIGTGRRYRPSPVGQSVRLGAFRDQSYTPFSPFSRGVSPINKKEYELEFPSIAERSLPATEEINGSAATAFPHIVAPSPLKLFGASFLLA